MTSQDIFDRVQILISLGVCIFFMHSAKGSWINIYKDDLTTKPITLQGNADFICMSLDNLIEIKKS